MTLDQQLQLWNVIGTWLASIGTIAAVIVALYLARRVEKVRLKVYVGLVDVLMGDGSPIQPHLGFKVTNLGERPVTINSIGWAIGKGKKRRVAVQTVSGPFTHAYPAELSHGKSADFMVSFVQTKNWGKDFATGFVKDPSDKNLKTLVGLVQTSVGQTIEVRPDKRVLELLKRHAPPDPSNPS
jgi:hypothetical protein